MQEKNSVDKWHLKEECEKKANLHYEKGEYVDAIKICDKIIADFPQDVKALKLRGNAKRMLGRYEEAEQDQQQAQRVEQIRQQQNQQRAQQQAQQRAAEKARLAERASLASCRLLDRAQQARQAEQARLVAEQQRIYQLKTEAAEKRAAFANKK